MEVAYRPSHADATYDFKYGIRAVAGGGRSSARETIGRVAAGAVAKKLLSQLCPGTEVRVAVTCHQQCCAGVSAQHNWRAVLVMLTGCCRLPALPCKQQHPASGLLNCLQPPQLPRRRMPASRQRGLNVRTGASFRACCIYAAGAGIRQQGAGCWQQCGPQHFHIGGGEPVTHPCNCTALHMMSLL